MTIKEIVLELRSTLIPAVGTAEAKAMADIIVEDVLGYTKTKVLLNDSRTLLDGTISKMRQIAAEVVRGLPLQYALKQARWRGRVFGVGPDVLIPRPETAQLVDMIIDKYQQINDVRVLDIGTGSGCIAISLALDLPFARVDAIDISSAAVKMAQANAADLKAKVNIVEADAMSLTSNNAFANNTYDVIVSNPPYILNSERASLDARVRDHEPEQALFVSDEAPVAIYEAIARYAAKALSENGSTYLEVNPLTAQQVVNALKHNGLADATAICDYRGNTRFVVASKR